MSTKNYIAKADKKTSSTKIQYSMFVGRWQPLHAGHKWLFSQALEEGKNVLICIRDVEPDERNPYTTDEVLVNISTFYRAEIYEGRVKVMVIPDIESVNYGRGVGYDVIEWVPPGYIAEISATKIREELKERGELPNGSFDDQIWIEKSIEYSEYLRSNIITEDVPHTFKDWYEQIKKDAKI